MSIDSQDVNRKSATTLLQIRCRKQFATEDIG